MKQDNEKIKIEIILIMAIMCVLYTICMVLYSPTFSKNPNMEVETTLELKNANTKIAQDLQSLIPYVDTTNTKYTTAYQEKTTNIFSIHNEVLLQMSLLKLNNSNFTKKDLEEVITNLYGNDLFITYESFSPTPETLCKYNNLGSFSCSQKNYQGIKYSSIRKRQNLEFKDNLAILTEKNIFYSEEKINDITYYKIYSDGSRKTVKKVFTTKDLQKENAKIEAYLDLEVDNWVTYESTFKLNKQNYNWINTRKVEV